MRPPGWRARLTCIMFPFSQGESSPQGYVRFPPSSLPLKPPSLTIQRSLSLDSIYGPHGAPRYDMQRPDPALYFALQQRPDGEDCLRLEGRLTVNLSREIVGRMDQQCMARWEFPPWIRQLPEALTGHTSLRVCCGS
jgi:hypothetical protein